jgi:hypothetical protein
MAKSGPGPPVQINPIVCSRLAVTVRWSANVDELGAAMGRTLRRPASSVVEAGRRRPAPPSLGAILHGPPEHVHELWRSEGQVEEPPPLKVLTGWIQ